MGHGCSDGDDVAAGSDNDEDMDEDKEFDEDAAEMSATKDLSSLTRLYGSKTLNDHLEATKNSMARDTPQPYTPEHKEDYELTCKSNEVVYELEQETIALTTYVRQSYSPRFPELEALIQNHLDYVRTVLRLGNIPGGDATQVDLAGVLPSATVMVVTVTATTTSGKELPQEALDKVSLSHTTSLPVARPPMLPDAAKAHTRILKRAKPFFFVVSFLVLFHRASRLSPASPGMENSTERGVLVSSCAGCIPPLNTRAQNLVHPCVPSGDESMPASAGA